MQQHHELQVTLFAVPIDTLLQHCRAIAVSQVILVSTGPLSPSLLGCLAAPTTCSHNAHMLVYCLGDMPHVGDGEQCEQVSPSLPGEPFHSSSN